MKHPTSHRPWRRAAARLIRILGFAAALPAVASAQIRTLLDLPDGVSGDYYTRGFYIPAYPGTSMNSVKLYMKTPSGTWPYQISITAHQGSYDGPVVASGFASVTLNDTTESEVHVQMIQGFQTNPPVDPASTIAFTIGVNRQPGAPDPLYAVPPFTGGDPRVVQTGGTTPPLDTFRRNGVKIQVTGNKFLEVGPGYSIQFAIDHADPGDTVHVLPGTYHEDLTLRGGIDVVGTDPATTIVDGTGSGDVVTASGITDMEFSGFTVQGGGSGDFDAGVSISNSTILLSNNHISGNTLGIQTSNSNSVICGNLITGNGNPSNTRVDHGIHCAGNDLIAGNRIVGNLESGVLCIGSTTAPQVINNTIADNAGRGLQAASQAQVVLKNTIVANNGSQGIFSENNSVVESTYNCLFGNSPDIAVISGGTVADHLGEILVDPFFDPLLPGEYRLDIASPCIDAGDPSPVYDDLDGTRSDIGATGGPCGSAAPAGTLANGFLWTSVGTIPVSEIDQSGGAKAGLTLDRDRPFGGSPWLYGPFGTSVAPFRYDVRIARWTGGTPPSAGDFTYVDDPLSKVRYTFSGGTVHASTVALGPNTVNGRPTYVPTLNSGSAIWAHENLRVILNTLRLDNGRYSVRIGAYDVFDNPITLSPNPDLILTVNNTRPEVSIDAVSHDGGPPVDECAFINLASETSTLDFVYTAHHPDGYLDNFALVGLSGRNHSAGTITSDSYTNHPDPAGIWTGASMAAVAATPVSPALPLPNLQPWHTCAYQFRLTAWARTTNGFGRIYHRTFFDNYAIDLRPATGSGADLDGDGDVDADDLALFAAAYGTTP